MLNKCSMLPILAFLSLTTVARAADVQSEIQTLTEQRILFRDTAKTLETVSNAVGQLNLMNEKAFEAYGKLLKENEARAQNYESICNNIQTQVEAINPTGVTNYLQKESEMTSTEFAMLPLSEITDNKLINSLQTIIKLKNRMKTCSTLASILSGAKQVQLGKNQ